MSRQQTPNGGTTSGHPTASSEQRLQSQAEVQVDDDDGENKYRCPFCGVSYSDEILTRIHITRSEDASHLNHDGFMPETKVEVTGDDGETVDTLSRRPRDVDTSSLGVDVFPDSVSKQHRHILLVAATNPYERAYTELENKVQDRLAEYDDLDCPSYSTIRRVIRSFYRPQEESTSEESNADDETLADLTPKQQAIIIAKCLSPDSSTTKIAKQIECAESYPAQVFDNANDILATLEEQMSGGADPQAVIREHLTEDDIRELVGRDLLENLPIDGKDLRSNSETSTEQKWGSPHTEVMSADPHGVEHIGGSRESSSTDSRQDAKDDSTDRNQIVSGEERDEHKKQSISAAHSEAVRTELTQLRDKIAFVRTVADYADDEETGNELLVSFAEQIETRIDTILRETATVE